MKQWELTNAIGILNTGKITKLAFNERLRNYLNAKSTQVQKNKILGSSTKFYTKHKARSSGYEWLSEDAINISIMKKAVGKWYYLDPLPPKPCNHTTVARCLPLGLTT